MGTVVIITYDDIPTALKYVHVILLGYITSFRWSIWLNYLHSSCVFHWQWGNRTGGLGDTGKTFSTILGFPFIMKMVRLIMKRKKGNKALPHDCIREFCLNETYLTMYRDSYLDIQQYFHCIIYRSKADADIQYARSASLDYSIIYLVGHST